MGFIAPLIGAFASLAGSFMGGGGGGSAPPPPPPAPPPQLAPPPPPPEKSDEEVRQEKEKERRRQLQATGLEDTSLALRPSEEEEQVVNPTLLGGN